MRTRRPDGGVAGRCRRELLELAGVATGETLRGTGNERRDHDGRRRRTWAPVKGKGGGESTWLEMRRRGWPGQGRRSGRELLMAAGPGVEAAELLLGDKRSSNEETLRDGSGSRSSGEGRGKETRGRGGLTGRRGSRDGQHGAAGSGRGMACGAACSITGTGVPLALAMGVRRRGTWPWGLGSPLVALRR